MRSFRLTRPQLSENDIEKVCLDLLRVRGYWVLRVPSGLYRTLDGRRVVTIGQRGLPDYFAVHHRHPGFLLEVKRPRGKPKPHQAQKIDELRVGYRIAVYVADSASGLKDWLDRHERGPP